MFISYFLSTFHLKLKQERYVVLNIKRETISPKKLLLNAKKITSGQRGIYFLFAHSKKMTADSNVMRPIQ